MIIILSWLLIYYRHNFWFNAYIVVTMNIIHHERIRQHSKPSLVCRLLWFNGCVISCEHKSKHICFSQTLKWLPSVKQQNLYLYYLTVFTTSVVLDQCDDQLYCIYYHTFSCIH